MKTAIIEFQPNTDARKAAEVLAGMRAIGAVETWAYNDMESKFAFRFSDGIEHSCAARDVIWMGRGALAVLHRATDALSVGAT